MLEYSCYGKPYLENRVSYFNLSHAKDYVICATSQEDIGVDIEYIRPLRVGIAERILTPEEYEHFIQTDMNEKESELIRLWTMKESIMKLIGCGITKSMKEISIRDFCVETFQYDMYHISIARKRI